MKTALYTKYVEPSMHHHLENLVLALHNHHIETTEFSDSLPHQDFDFVLSIGGDGTLLSCVHHIVDSGIPIIGVNFGHLGFRCRKGFGSHGGLLKTRCFRFEALRAIWFPAN